MPVTPLLWAGALFLGTGLTVLFFSAGAGEEGCAGKARCIGQGLFFVGCAALFVWALTERHLILAGAAVIAGVLGVLGFGRGAGRAGGSA